MDEKARRNLGAHYTSEKNIMKVIKPLFLDELETQFEKSRNDKRALQVLHNRISKLKFLDPACGCGNFLIISYRELRLLELKLVKQLLQNQQVTSINDYFLVDVDQFYGIEYEDFPSQIAQVAMWLIDHQMNEMASLAFGEYYKRIPLKKSATIVHGNALRIDWQSMLRNDSKYNYILGNPPFIGKHYQSKQQREDLAFVFNDLKGSTDLDYVTAWYKVAADYMLNNNATAVAFVSTNSITQGEQVPILWNYLFQKYKLKINFAHRTFRWGNEARGNAHVHVVIIGFSLDNKEEKLLFEYETFTSDPTVIRCKNISPYLTPASDIVITKRSKPLLDYPTMRCGNKPSDGGHLILDDIERKELLNKYPASSKFIKLFLGSEEFINNKVRYCLWLKDASPSEIKSIDIILSRVQKVKEFRLKSTAEPTRKAASTPYLFFFISQPNTNYIAIPEVSSERRNYIPIGFLNKDIIASNKIYIIETSSMYMFGVLSSVMHMSWTRLVAGRLESRYQYSGSMVYNNFPWAKKVSEKQKEAVEKAAQAVLDARAQFPNASLADLYDPNTMPPALVKAHQSLDKAVDLCYRPQPFPNETKRIEFLFELYDKYTSGMFQPIKKTKKKKE
jgi:hypothetical protein